MSTIVLATLNARYTHTSLGLRYLQANLNELKDESLILEFVINENIPDMVEKILSYNPKIVGLSTYIWNAEEIRELLIIIKKVSPQTIVVLGGPEVSHAPLRLDFSAADYIIQGEADLEFYNLCKKLLNNDKIEQRIISAAPPVPDEIQLPYSLYSDEDITNRVIYVEASRGCPYKCEFCLSSIDKSVRYFNTDILLGAFEKLWQRGARKFKFIDRSFNLDITRASLLMDFFLDKTPPYFIHFEVIPDNFPESLKERLKQFPPASLQLEIGIQTLNPEVAENISRPLNFEKIRQNLHFLETETPAHLHVDLIVGLPGESLESFRDNLNNLVRLTGAEIQVGILKKLSGTAISRHDIQHCMVYSDKPPYEILKNDLISFDEMQKMKRFARFWDMIYNSGNFNRTKTLLKINDNSFDGFYDLSEWIYNKTMSTWQISMARLAELIFSYLTEVKKFEADYVAGFLVKDILKIEGRKLPPFLREYSHHKDDAIKRNLDTINKRQLKHLD